MDLFDFDFSNEPHLVVIIPTLINNNDVIKQTINQRRRQLTVHSGIYYSYGTSLISDEKWEQWAQELVRLHCEYPEIASECVDHVFFKDFDGTTGFNLPFNKASIHKEAEWLIEQHKAMESKN